MEQYRRGMSLCNNFIPALAGPVYTRPGSVFLGLAGDQSNAVRMFAFVLDGVSDYQVELGESGGVGYARFWRDGSLIMSGGSPYTIVSPYAATALSAISHRQSGDVLFMAHPSYAPRTLTRTSDTSWAFATFTTLGGPFQDINPDATTTLQASAATGSVTVTASAALFTAADVGRKVYIESPAGYNWAPWQAGTAYAAGVRVRSDGKTYLTAAGGTSGAVTPVHEYGTMSDGTVLWTYEDPGYGWGSITAVVDSTHATVTTESRYPQLSVSYASNRWALGEWYGVGVAMYPSHVAFFRDRLVFARSADQMLWFSVTGGYNDFQRKNLSGEVADDLSIAIEVVGDSVSGIAWTEAMPEALIVGTFGGVHTVAETTRQEVFSPSNVTVRMISSEGSANVRAVSVCGDIVYAGVGNYRLLRVYVDVNIDRIGVEDLSILSGEVAAVGELVAIGGSVSPGVMYRTVANLGGLVFDTKQGVFAHWLGTGGRPHQSTYPDDYIESISVAPVSALTRAPPTVYLVVKRAYNGITRRWIEVMALEYNRPNLRLGSLYPPCMDGMITGTSAAGTPTVIALGAAYAQLPVNVWCYPTGYIPGYAGDWTYTGKEFLADGSGNVTLTGITAATTWIVGFAYTAYLQTMPLEAEDGASVTLPKRCTRAVVRGLRQRFSSGYYPFSVLASLNYQTKTNAPDDEAVSGLRAMSRLGSGVYDEAANTRGMDYEAVMNGSTDTTCSLALATQDGTTVLGAPCRVYLLRAYMEIGDR